MGPTRPDPGIAARIALRLMLLGGFEARLASGGAVSLPAKKAQARLVCPPVARCHLGLGKLYRRPGTREQVQEHLTTATAMYREMGMTYWLEKAEAEMTQLGG